MVQIVYLTPHYEHPTSCQCLPDIGDLAKTLEMIEKFNGLYWFNNNWLPSGMITSGTTGSGTITWEDHHVDLHTGLTSGSSTQVAKRTQGLTGAGSWGKKRFFAICGYIHTYSAQYVHIVSGSISSVSASPNTTQHIGFKIINNNIYGTVANGTTESVLLLETLTTDGYRALNCAFTPAVECRFYVDGVDKGAITTNLPSGTTNAIVMLYVSIYNTEAVDKRIDIFESRTYQEE